VSCCSCEIAGRGSPNYCGAHRGATTLHNCKEAARYGVFPKKGRIK